MLQYLRLLRSHLSGYWMPPTHVPLSGDIEAAFLPIHTLRHELGLPHAPFWGPGEILRHHARLPRIAHLRNFTEADLSVARVALRPVTASAPQVATADFGAAHGLNPLYVFARARELRVQRIEFHDVYFMQAGARSCIFQGERIDCRSGAMPGVAAIDSIARGNVEHVSRMLWCGDQFTPDNPAHFIGDHLSRAIFSRDREGVPPDEIWLGATQASLCAVLQKRVDPLFRNAVAGTIYHVEKLAMLSPSVPDQANGHPFFFGQADILRVLRTAMRTTASDSSGAGPHIYLSRRAMTRRPLVNEAALIDALRAQGFAILEMERLAGTAQLGAMAEARLIVAPHGAALISLLAAQPGAQCIELFHPRRGTMAFALTAAFANVRYQPMLGRAIDRDKWEIDIDRVLAAIPD